MKDNKLEIGDLVFRWHGSFDSYLQIYEVVRLTPTQAILKGGTKVKNELTPQGFGEEELGAKIIGESYANVLLASERLYHIFKEQKIRRKAKELLNNLKVKELSLSVCEELIRILSQATQTHSNQ